MEANNKMRAEVIASLVVLEARGRGQTTTIEDISGALALLHDSGIHLNVALRRVPRGSRAGRFPAGYYSEDVEAFAGRLSMGGYGGRGEKGTFNLEAEGARLCAEIIRDSGKENPEDLRVVIEHLDVDLLAVLLGTE